MNMSEIASKEQFVEHVKDRLTKAYTVRIHSIGTLLAIGFSFYFTFLYSHDPLPIVSYLWNINEETAKISMFLELETINIVIFVGIFFFYKFIFKGLSISSAPFFVSYRYGPTDFLKWTYLFVSLAAIMISIFGLEFTREGKTGPLSSLEAFYYVVGVVSTTGSDISPASRAAEVLSILFSAMTLMFVVFFFQHIASIESNRKIYFGFAQRWLEYAYDELTGLIAESELTREEKLTVFNYFLDKFDFDTEDGTAKVVSYMRNGNFSFCLR